MEGETLAAGTRATCGTMCWSILELGCSEPTGFRRIPTLCTVSGIGSGIILVIFLCFAVVPHFIPQLYHCANMSKY
jgi:hypothetical protein